MNAYPLAASSTGKLHVLDTDGSLLCAGQYRTTYADLTITKGARLKTITCRTCFLRLENLWGDGNRHRRMGTEESYKAMRRWLEAYGRNVKESPDLDALRQLADLAEDIDNRIIEVIEHLRSEEGGAHSWAQIADQFGISRQLAQQRWGKKTAPGANQPGQGRPARFR